MLKEGTEEIFTAKGIQEGSIVRSMAGHDAKGFFVVFRCEGDMLWLADGKRRLLAKPKAKKQKHVARTSCAVDLSKVNTDKKVRRVLRSYQENSGKAVAESGR